MLVLSRKAGEAIVFPALDITVSLAQIRGRTVTLGIEAPNQVQILREELVPKLASSCTQKTDQTMAHPLRNKLSSVEHSLRVLLSQIESGQVPAPSVVSNAFGDLLSLEESFAPPSQTCYELDPSPRALVVDSNEDKSKHHSATLIADAG